MAMSGTITGTTNNQYITVKIDWSATSNLDANTSTITATMYARKSTSSSAATEGRGTWHLYIDGQSATFTWSSTPLKVNNDNKWVKIGATTKTVNHNTDGTKTLTISGDGGTNMTSWSSTSVSGTVTLATIPRETAATFDDNTHYFGGQVVIGLNRKDSSYTHTLKYVWNGNEVTIAENVGTTYTWTVPLSLISAITDTNQAYVEIDVITYKADGSVLGTTQNFLLCNVPNTAAPVINSITITDTGTVVPASWGLFIKGKSVLHVKVNASGQYGATVTGYRIEALDQVKNSNDVDVATIYSSGNIPVKVTVIDSRGLSTTTTQQAAVSAYDYAAPAINTFSAVRCNVDGEERDNGTYALVDLSCSISDLNGHNTMTARIYSMRSDTSTWVLEQEISPSGTSLTASYIIDNIAAAYTYAIKLEVDDYFTDLSGQPSTIIQTVAAEGAIISWLNGGLGIAFGKTAEDRLTADFGWKIRGRQGMELDSPLGLGSGGTGGTTKPTACAGIGAVYQDGTWDVSHLTATQQSAASFLQVIKSAILELEHPVGSTWVTFDDSDDPATRWGGTWEKIEGKMLLGSSSTHSTGDTGGQESVNTPDHIHATGMVVRTDGAAAGYMSGDGTTTKNLGTKTVRYFNSQGSASAARVYTGGPTSAGKISTMPPYIACNIWRRTA